MEHFWCWAKPTIIYVIALIIFEICNYFTFRIRLKSAYLQGRIDVMKEYCWKMEQIDKWFKSMQESSEEKELVIAVQLADSEK